MGRSSGRQSPRLLRGAVSSGAGCFLPPMASTTCQVSAATACSPRTSSGASPSPARAKDSHTSPSTTIKVSTALASQATTWHRIAGATPLYSTFLMVRPPERSSSLVGPWLATSGSLPAARWSWTMPLSSAEHSRCSTPHGGGHLVPPRNTTDRCDCLETEARTSFPPRRSALSEPEALAASSMSTFPGSGSGILWLWTPSESTAPTSQDWWAHGHATCRRDGCRVHWLAFCGCRVRSRSKSPSV